jgi:DNA-directed RNA polymerase specialized sigma24 family protein
MTLRPLVPGPGPRSADARVSPPRRGRRDITEAEFQALLAWFDPSRARAAERYETMRDRIVWYLEFRGCPTVDSWDLADITLTIAARRLARGKPIDSKTFFLGVARRVLSEYRRRRLRRSQPLTDDVDVVTAETPADALIRVESARRVLDAMAGMNADTRMLLAQYDDFQSRPGGREALARQRGKSIGALYVEVCRARTALRRVLGREPRAAPVKGPARPRHSKAGDVGE